MSRLETGVVQPEGDWPGVFIRGDNAFALAMAIKHVAATIPDDADAYLRMAKSQIEGLGKLLLRANANSEDHHVDQVVTARRNTILEVAVLAKILTGASGA